MALAGSSLLLASACQPTQPKGQVIAIVDGVEVTLSELNAEARARNIPIRTDRVQRDQAISDLVGRKLLVRAARARGIDRTPEFVLAERRLDETLLAQQLLATRLAESAPATEQQLQQLIATSPELARASRSPPAEQRRLALDLFDKQRTAQDVDRIIAAERTTASIRYQPGYAPTAPGK